MPADYSRHTGGWFYDRRLATELEALGWSVEWLRLPPGFPRPDQDARDQTARLIADVPDHAILLMDQLALGVLPEIAQREGDRLSLVMIVHHPLAMEEGLPPAEAGRFLVSERRALRHVALVIVPSAATADALTKTYGVPAAHIEVARPGTDLQTVSPGSTDNIHRLLSIGSIVPRKDHGALISALAGLVDLPWRLTLVGSEELAPDHARSVRDLVARMGLKNRVTMTGPLEAMALESHWRSCDLYVAASRHEGYGMAVSEAIARGIPVVTTEAGAVGSWLDRRSALVVPVADASAMGDALSLAIGDGALRQRLRQGAMAARTALPGWSSTATLVDRRLDALLATGAGHSS